MMTLGERIHLLRRRLGWTQRELAAAIRINVNNLARIERSEIKDPGGQLVARLAKAMGTSADFLLGLTEESGIIEEDRDLCPVAEVLVSA
jgi:transcriptional regulator with XRE-family HTH domain